HHIPFSAIRNVEGDRIYLNVGRDELDRMGYDEAPVESDEDDVADDVRRGDESRRTTTAMETDAVPPVGGTARDRNPVGEHRRLLLREEELVPRTRTVQAGQVRLETDVVSEQRTVEVPLTREEVYVERHEVDRRPADRPIAEKGETIEVPVMEEQVTVEKRPVVYEEVEVGTRQSQRTESVDATVRREELRVEDQGQAIQGTGAGRSTWASAMPAYRQRWEQQYGTSGRRWEDVEPAYQYGYGLRNQPQYRDRKWSEIEPDVQRDWSRTHPDTPWDRAGQAIQDAWQRATD
ncbi:MAG: YsnF/AvaK domain-containing protein, partial [Chloroflexi bacterium]|nr:YsnF/AvaK domain-containing protein [Chloroflexota bacterium]